MILEGKVVVITGGTGSLGKILVKRILSGELGLPKKIIVFSRDEAKQHFMRLEYLNNRSATDDIIYQNFKQLLTFRIGDVRDYHSVSSVIRDADIVFNAAALKQVPTCEYFPYEAVRTNIEGPENIIRSIRDHGLPVETVIGISTDKACKPVNVMGMTKSIQERIFIRGNLECPDTRFSCVRYGNVLASRGSVIPFFHEQIKNGGPLTITEPDMTRFLISLDQAVDTVFSALTNSESGETFIPQIPSAKIMDLAEVLIGDRDITIETTGIRPGEKLHEILVSEEEVSRTIDKFGHYVIRPILPEIGSIEGISPALTKEYSSEDDLMSKSETKELLKKHHLMVEDIQSENSTEFLR